MSIEDSIQELVEKQVEKVFKPSMSRLMSENSSLSLRLKSTEEQLEKALEKLSTRNNQILDNELTGNKIDGGMITHFASTGISDQATDMKVEIKDELVTVKNNMHVDGTFTCDTIQYYNAKCDDLEVKNSVRINGVEVVQQDRLGKAIKISSLQEVGVLRELNVADTFTVEGSRVGINSLNPGGTLGVAKDGLEVIIDVVSGTPFVGVNTSDKFAIGTNREPTLYISHDNKVGIKMKNPKQDLDIAGAIRFQGQTHQYDTQSPKAGTWQQGDVCWNAEADAGKPLGWVCVKSGAPGTWRVFGNIS